MCGPMVVAPWDSRCPARRFESLTVGRCPPIPGPHHSFPHTHSGTCLPFWSWVTGHLHGILGMSVPKGSWQVASCSCGVCVSVYVCVVTLLAPVTPSPALPELWSPAASTPRGPGTSLSSRSCSCRCLLTLAIKLRVACLPSEALQNLTRSSRPDHRHAAKHLPFVKPHRDWRRPGEWLKAKPSAGPGEAVEQVDSWILEAYKVILVLWEVTGQCLLFLSFFFF